MIRFEVEVSRKELEHATRALAAIPLQSKRVAVGSANHAAHQARADMAAAIQRDTGINSLSLISRAIAVRYASENAPQAEAVIFPLGTRIPLKHWPQQHRQQSQTRATVYVRKGGEWVRVWGFVNPLGPRRYVLDRHTGGSADSEKGRGGRGHLAVRDGRGWLESAPGSSIKQSFSAALTPSLGSGVQRDLISEFMRRFNAGEIFGKVA